MSTVKNEIIIDVSFDDRARLDDNHHLFHPHVYKKLADKLKERLDRNNATSTHQNNVNHTRSHDAILLDGGRGNGKTSILVNLAGYVERESERKEILNHTLFLDPVDPTLLDDTEDFLNIVIGQLNRSKVVKERLDALTSNSAEAYYSVLESLAAALEGEQTTKERYGLDRMLSYQGSLEITQLTHDYFREVLKLCDKKLIVLPVDDVDMSLSQGFKVLEVVRKYLCSPYILPIVSGDLRLYQQLVVNRFSEELTGKQRPSDYSNLARRAEELSVEYLRKVFPVTNRLRVPTVESYFENISRDGLLTTVTVKKGKRELINLAGLYNLLHTVLNGRVNGDENSAMKFEVDITARQLVQLLRALEPVLDQLQVEELPLRFENLIDAQKWWLKQNKDIVLSFVDSLAEHFQHTQQVGLHELCKALKLINSQAIDLGELAYFNPLLQLDLKDEIGELRHNENFALYSKEGIPEFQRLFERLPAELREATIHSLAPLPAIEPVDQKLRFKSKYNPNDPDAQFFLSLFSHSDFYTSYQTAPLVFFGRFFELVITSLIQDVNDVWLRKILLSPPYFSILRVSATKTFDLDEDVDESAEDAQPIHEIPTLYLKTFADEINKFRQTYKLDLSPFVDVSLLQAVQSKYFNQANLYKMAGYRSIDKKGMRPALSGDALLVELALRATYTFKSAVGSFEKSKLYFEVPGSIVHQNFAAVSKAIAPTSIANNNSYRFNIKPFLDLETVPSGFRIPLTKLLDTHPLFVRLINWAEQKYRVPVQEVQAVLPKTPSVRRPHFSDAAGEVMVKMGIAAVPKDSKEIAALLSKLDQIALEATKNNSKKADIFLKNIGLSIKSRQFHGEKRTLNRLLAATWNVLLKQNIDAIKDANAFKRYLIKAGVTDSVASKLAKGF